MAMLIGIVYLQVYGRVPPGKQRVRLLAPVERFPAISGARVTAHEPVQLAQAHGRGLVPVPEGGGSPCWRIRSFQGGPQPPQARVDRVPMVMSAPVPVTGSLCLCRPRTTSRTAHTRQNLHGIVAALPLHFKSGCRRVG